jgi:hypothetical protein
MSLPSPKDAGFASLAIDQAPVVGDLRNCFPGVKSHEKVYFIVSRLTSHIPFRL